MTNADFNETQARDRRAKRLKVLAKWQERKRRRRSAAFSVTAFRKLEKSAEMLCPPDGVTIYTASYPSTLVAFQLAAAITDQLARAEWLPAAKEVARGRLRENLAEAQAAYEKAQQKIDCAVRHMQDEGRPRNYIKEREMGLIQNLNRTEGAQVLFCQNEVRRGIFDPVVRPAFGDEAPCTRGIHLWIDAHRALAAHVVGKPEAHGLNHTRPLVQTRTAAPVPANT